MSNWSEIKNAFFNWMEINNKNLDEDVDQNSRYDIMRSDEFRAFIVEYDEEDNTDTFKFSTKTNDLDETRKKEEEERQRLIEENDGKALEPDENRAFVNVEVEDSDDLAHDMVNSFLAGLDKTNEKDMAIIKAIGGDDGIISTEERDNFENKIIQHGFDGDKTDLSYTDVKSAIKTMMEDEDNSFEFLQETPGVDQTGGSDQVGGDDPPTGDPTEPFKGDGDDIPVTDQDLIDLNLTGYEPQVARYDSSFSMSNLNSSTVKNFDFSSDWSNRSVSELVSTRTNVENAIGEAQNNFGLYKTQYTNANATMMKASNCISYNEQKYAEIIATACAKNENIRLLNDQITTHEETINQSTELVNSLGATKDSLNASLSSIGSAIAGLRGQCTTYSQVPKRNSAGEVIPGEYVSQPNFNQELYNQRLAELRAEEDRIKQELKEVAEQLLEQEKIINQTNEQLQLAYTNLEEQISATDVIDEANRALFNEILENKKVYSQARADMASAQAGMSAMDAYIVSLAAECDEIEEAIEARKEKEAQDARDAENEEKAKEIEATEKGQFADGKAPQSDFSDENGNAINFPGAEQIPENGNLKDIKFDENGNLLSYTVTVNGYTITATFDENGNAKYSRDFVDENIPDETLTLNADNNLNFGGTGFENYYVQNTDGSYTVQRTYTDDGVQYTQNITSKQDTNGNQTIEIKITDESGKITKHQTRTIKAEVGSGSYGRKDTYTTVIRDEIAKTTTTITDINNGSVEHTSICKTEYNDGKTKELKTVTLNGDVTYSATTTVEKHATGGSQGGAIHTITTTINNLTGEKTVKNHTIASDKYGTKTETTTVTEYDANGNIITPEPDTPEPTPEATSEETTFSVNGKNYTVISGAGNNMVVKDENGIRYNASYDPKDGTYKILSRIDNDVTQSYAYRQTTGDTGQPAVDMGVPYQMRNNNTL
ncbi:MAG: hypothetical protein IKL52_07525 [Candidatus Gastranaerophilales bacterium]|nr:hypothetical protein [Candidatus Gastranaerophilales bacterium]